MYLYIRHCLVVIMKAKKSFQVLNYDVYANTGYIIYTCIVKPFIWNLKLIRTKQQLKAMFTFKSVLS